MKYAFIRKHNEEFSVAHMCAVLDVSRSGYYEWVRRPPSAHRVGDDKLLIEIRRVHLAFRCNYGAIKTWRELRNQGIACGKHRVSRLRRQNGIEARRRRRFRLSVENHHTAPAAPNLVQRRFEVNGPNRVWVGDMTFIRTRVGFLYLAVLLDLFGRKVVGWSMHDRPNLELMLGALTMALANRRPGPGLVHHTDQGVLYAAGDYRNLMGKYRLVPSMSRRGDCYDNAVAESFFSNLKNELVHQSDFASRESARAAIFEYIEVFYNRQRAHQTLGYMSPVAFEQHHGVA